MDGAPSLSPAPQTDRSGIDAAAEVRTDLAGILWRFALRPSVVTVVAVGVLLLVLAAIFLPQLPDDLRDEPAASARWFLETATSYGAVGPLLRGIGLFDVLHSLLFRLSIAALTLLLAVHFAAQLGNALAIHSLRRRLCTLPELSLRRQVAAAGRSVHQYRRAVAQDTFATQDRAVDILSARFSDVSTCRYTLRTSATQSPPAQPRSASTVTEHRSLAVRNRRSYWLRPLMPLGLLVAQCVVWLFLIVGWEWHSPALAPGDTVRLPSHNVVLSYQMEDNMREPMSEGAEGDVVIQIGDRTLTETTSSAIRARIGASGIVGHSGEPALLIRVTDGSPMLSTPGQTDLTDSIGVVLPSPGSEESVLVPELAAGLRTVRRTDDPDSFFVELYRGAETRPQQRIEVKGPTVATVVSGEQTIELEFVPVPGVEVTIRHMPARWMLWAALALALAGFAGVVRRPSMALTEIGPWPAARTLVSVYADDESELAEIENAIVVEPS